MPHLAPYIGNFLLPMQPCSLDFFVKNEETLDPFQLFLLDCLQEEVPLEEIENATQFTRNMLESSILGMVSQGLLSKTSDTYTLTPLAQKIVASNNWVVDAWQEKKEAWFNLIQNECQPFDPAQSVTGKGPQDLLLKRNSAHIQEEILEDNLSSYLSLFAPFHQLDAAAKKRLLPTLSLKLRGISGEKTRYLGCPIQFLPCFLPVNLSSKGKEEHPIPAKDQLYYHGVVFEISIHIYAEEWENPSAELKNLVDCYQKNPTTLTEEEVDLACRYLLYHQVKVEQRTFYADSFSRSCLPTKPENIGRRNVHLELPSMLEISTIEMAQLLELVPKIYKDLKGIPVTLTWEKQDFYGIFSLDQCINGKKEGKKDG